MYKRQVRGHDHLGGGEAEHAGRGVCGFDGQREGDRRVGGVGVGHRAPHAAGGVLRDLRGVRGRRGEDSGVRGRGEVEAAAARLEGVVLRGLPGAAGQQVLQLASGEVRMSGGHQRGGARHVGRGHGGAAHGLVGARVVAVEPGVGRQDADAGRGDLRLQGAVHAGALAGEVGHGVAGVDGAHGQRGARRARCADGGGCARVAGRDDEQRARLGAELVDGLAEGVGSVGRPRLAETHVDDLGVLVDRGPFHAGQDPGGLSGAGVVQHLGDVEAGTGGDALLPAVGGRAGAGDDGRDMCAVAEVVVGVLARYETLPARDAVHEVGVSRVDAGVEDRHVHALSGVALRPDLRRADLLGAVGEVGVDEAVQPDVRDPVGEGGCGGLLAGSVGRRRPGHGLPEVRGARAVRGEGGAAYAVEGADPGRPGGQSSGLEACAGGVRVGDDERQLVAVRIVVPVGDHVRDVEQLPVQGALGDEGQYGLGEHVEVVARRQDAGLNGAPGGTADADGASGLAVGAGAPPGGDHVTGDQCDGVVARGHPVGRGCGGRGVETGC